jgi:hypothetical protein
MCLEFLEVCVKVTKLLGQDVCIRDKVEILLPMALLHADHILAQFVFARDFIAGWEVIDLLILIQALIQVALTPTVTP